MKNRLFYILFALFFISYNGLSNPKTAVYNFNNLNAGAINGQDNWVNYMPPGFWTYTYVLNGGYGGTKSIVSTAQGGQNNIISRKNDNNFKIPRLNAKDNDVEFTFIASAGCWVTLVGLGYDDNGDGVIKENETAFRLYLTNCVNFNGFVNSTGTQTSATFVHYAWTRYKVALNFAANGGQGTASVSREDLSGNAGYIAIPELQNLNLDMDPTAKDHRNPRKLNGIHIQYDSDGRIIDDISIKRTRSGRQNLD